MSATVLHDDSAVTRSVHEEAGAWIAAGRVQAVVDRTFPLEQAAQAHAYLEGGQHMGKIVLVP